MRTSRHGQVRSQESSTYFLDVFEDMVSEAFLSKQDSRTILLVQGTTKINLNRNQLNHA